MLGVLFLLLAHAPVDASLAQTDLYEEAIHHLSLNHLDRAHELLEKVEVGSKAFVPALEEIQKIHFIRKEWEKFFAYATFYRKALLSKKAEAQKNFSSRILSLELMGLARFCHWAVAERLAQASVEFAEELGLDSSELKRTQSIMQLSRWVTTHNQKQQVHSMPGNFFSNRLFWKIEDHSISQVRHPRVLKMKVKNLCES